MRIVLEIERGEGQGSEELEQDFIKNSIVLSAFREVVFKGTRDISTYSFVNPRVVEVKIETDAVDPIDPETAWLTLCAKAAKMKSEQYQRWQFIVGTGGTVAERVARGERALEYFQSLMPGIEGIRTGFEKSVSSGINCNLKCSVRHACSRVRKEGAGYCLQAKRALSVLEY